ncbi:MAG: DNA-directed RNA polymerase subunit beta', partial [Evtepia sp.]|nr:DNA-directed RNA polymerase subunit beta' [Evtepia sp.]
ARKGLADTALRTADSGYLTRRLVDVSQEVIIREKDCGTDEGITVSEISENGQVIEPFAERLKGRYPVEDVVDPNTGELLFPKDHMLTMDDAKVLEDRGITSLKIRSVLTCRARTGVCSRCYGINLAIGEPVGEGEAVGIIAAQSIGEPGTQLTMRTFHTGGVAGGDITQGLPRVEELFEARKPKKMAQLAEISGRVTLEESKRITICNVTITGDDGEVVTYALPYSAGIRCKDGDWVTKGDQLTEGALSPHEVLRIRGVSAVHDYLIREVQKPYRQQGVDINDKHIEIIVRQMMRKVRVEDPGDSQLLSGATIELIEYLDAKAEVQARIDAGEKREDGSDLVIPTATTLLMGITKASLATDSFLSAASFQETTKVLTEAAIKGKVDHLIGLKENVIIGKLIPAGSGLPVYHQVNPREEESAGQQGKPNAYAAVAAAVSDLHQQQEEQEELAFEEGPLEAAEPLEAPEDEVLSISFDE